MNDRPNGDLGNPVATSELARLLGAPIVLQANTKWMLTSGVLFLLTALFAWLINSPKDTHLYIVIFFSVLVGLVLGYRARQLKLMLDGAQPLRTAIGVGWRIGALWIMVSAVGEYLAEGSTSSTMDDFPGMFGVSILGVSSSFLAAYGARAALTRIRNRSDSSLGWLQVLNLLIGIGGLMVGVFGLFNDAGTGLDEKTRAGMAITSAEIVESNEDLCPPDLVANTDISCALMSTDGTLPDGSHYRSFGYSGTKDEQITISMIAEEFDAYLMLGLGDVSDGSFELLDGNDDGGIGLGTDSRLSYTLAEDRIYTVVANSFSMGETGTFKLRIDSER